jgi:hypothetical protein
MIVAEDFAPAFVGVALIALCSMFFFLRLPRNAGHALTSGKEVPADAREPNAQS